MALKEFPSLFGRVGAGPLSFEEQHKLYMRSDGKVWKVSDDPEDEDYKKAYHAPAKK